MPSGLSAAQPRPLTSSPSSEPCHKNSTPGLSSRSASRQSSSPVTAMKASPPRPSSSNSIKAGLDQVDGFLIPVVHLCDPPPADDPPLGHPTRVAARRAAVWTRRSQDREGAPSRWAPGDKSDRVLPGRSCHNRRYNQGPGNHRHRSEVNRTQVLQSPPATDSPVRKHAHLTPPQPSTSVLTKLRTAMINTSQHNLCRASESLRQSYMNRNRRSRATYWRGPHV